MVSYLDSILMGICDKLQLTQTLYDIATERYETIARTIQDDDAFSNVELSMYPHGSFRLKTTVRPLSGNEYDLDFVAELPKNSTMTPNELYNNIHRILSTDGVHNKMIEMKSRCIRVNYANDFHMDIMPAKATCTSIHEIIVPDRDLSKGWYHRSNPIGFAEWFESQARKAILLEMSAHKIMHASIEPVTDQEVTERLAPLRRAVQLVKRYRDVFCDRNSIEPVRSIVLCTLMGRINSYSGSAIQIVSRFCDYVSNQIVLADGKPFEVQNPVVDEVLSEKWKEGHNYQDFVDTISTLSSDVRGLQKMTINSEMNKLVKKMFGEEVTTYAINEYSKRINELRSDGKLCVDSAGKLQTNTNGVPVKKNTFYGDEL